MKFRYSCATSAKCTASRAKQTMQSCLDTQLLLLTARLAARSQGAASASSRTATGDGGGKPPKTLGLLGTSGLQGRAPHPRHPGRPARPCRSSAPSALAWWPSAARRPGTPRPASRGAPEQAHVRGLMAMLEGHTLACGSADAGTDALPRSAARRVACQATMPLSLIRHPPYSQSMLYSDHDLYPS